jgi:hypothetical protein
MPALHNGVDVGKYLYIRAVLMQQVKGCKDIEVAPSMARILTLTGH